MATFVGSATGTNSATLPAGWAPGDLAITFAYRDGSNTAPTLPAGWTGIATGGANTNSSRSGSRVLQSGDVNTGTWTNATSVIVLVYRPGAGETLSIGGGTRGTGAVASVTYPARTFLRRNGTSWSIRFSGHRSVDTTLETPPAGYTLRATLVDATDEVAAFDRSAITANPTADAVAVGGTVSGWEAHTIELRGTTLASATLDGSWSIRNLVGATFDGSWAIQQSSIVTGSFSGSWSIRNYVSGPVWAPVLIDGLPLEIDGQEVWIQDPNAFRGSWSIEAEAGRVSGSFAGSWAIRNYATAVLDGAWQIMSSASASFSGSWSIRGLASATFAGSYAIRNFASATLAGSWTIRNAATASFSGSWSIRNRVSSTLAGSWQIRSFVSTTFGGSWAIDAPAGTAVGSFSGSWSIRNHVSAAFAGSWSIRNRVTGATSGSWSIRTLATASLSGSWSIRNRVSSSFSGSWEILDSSSGRVSGSFNGSWAVRNFATGSMGGSWRILTSSPPGSVWTPDARAGAWTAPGSPPAGWIPDSDWSQAWQDQP